MSGDERPNVNERLARILRAEPEKAEAYAERCKLVGCTVSVLHDAYYVTLPEGYEKLSEREREAIDAIVYQGRPPPP